MRAGSAGSGFVSYQLVLFGTTVTACYMHLTSRTTCFLIRLKVLVISVKARCTYFLCNWSICTESEGHYIGIVRSIFYWLRYGNLAVSDLC